MKNTHCRAKGSHPNIKRLLHVGSMSEMPPNLLLAHSRAGAKSNAFPCFWIRLAEPALKRLTPIWKPYPYVSEELAQRACHQSSMMPSKRDSSKRLPPSIVSRGGGSWGGEVFPRKGCKHSSKRFVKDRAVICMRDPSRNSNFSDPQKGLAQKRRSSEMTTFQDSARL